MYIYTLHRGVFMKKMIFVFVFLSFLFGAMCDFIYNTYFEEKNECNSSIKENNQGNSSTEENNQGNSSAEENKEYYALDKVQVYIEQIDTVIAAKSVEYNGLEIYNDDNQKIISDGLSGYINGHNLGKKLVHSWVSSDDRVITDALVVSNTPINFYSARNEDNVFEEGTTINLRLDYTYNCHSGYIDGNKYIYDNNFNNHAGNKISRLSFKINSETIKTVTLIDDTAHGYKVCAKLHFVKI